MQAKGSLFCTRPTLNTYAAKREDLLSIANNLFSVVGSGKVKIPVNQTYALKDARKAHRGSGSPQDHGIDGARSVTSTLTFGKPALVPQARHNPGSPLRKAGLNHPFSAIMMASGSNTLPSEQMEF